MKVLHSADWHLGRTLYSKKERQLEHIAFLRWLLDTLTEQSVDVLLIAGDVFDTSTPGIASQKLYYDFLIQVQHTPCRNVIIVGGNHDSPSFLNAPKALLAALNIQVIGNATDTAHEQIILIKDKDLQPAMLVCAVPFLRERDISKFVEKENYTDRSKRVNEGIQKHYQHIAATAQQMRERLGCNIPIIATGHLSVIGGKRNDDDGVRDTYIGNVEAVGSDIFPDIFDYVALGHYHIPSVIKHHIRYCGSPIPMGFGEAKQQKSVCLLDFTDKLTIDTLAIPNFQQLESIVGDKAFIEQQLNRLKALGTSVWVEINYNGNELFPELVSWVNEQVSGSQVEVLKLQNRQYLNEVLTTSDTQDTLEALNPLEVFETLLAKNNISQAQQNELKATYKEIIDYLDTTD